MSNIATAWRIASKAHMGQLDKIGQPYINHPKWVSDNVQGNDAKCVAILHDVLEDSSLTINDVISAGFHFNVVMALVAITHKPHEPYMKYLQRVKANDLALEVKMVDIAHNMLPARLSKLPEETQVRLTEKYTNALAYLQG